MRVTVGKPSSPSYRSFEARGCLRPGVEDGVEVEQGAMRSALPCRLSPPVRRSTVLGDPGDVTNRPFSIPDLPQGGLLRKTSYRRVLSVDSGRQEIDQVTDAKS